MASDDVQGTKMADVYSFGVIVQEVTLQDEPFAGKQLDPEEIVQKIREGDKSMKPEVPDCKRHLLISVIFYDLAIIFQCLFSLLKASEMNL